MRLQIGGKPPAIPDFTPKEDGWTPLKEPSPWVLTLVSTPIGILAAALILKGWGASSVQIEVGSSFLVWMVAAVFIGLPALFTVHELLHGFGYRKFGFTPSTMIFIWPSKLLVIAITLDALRRNRLLLVYMLPLLVISVLPLIVCRSFGITSIPLMLASTANGLIAGGDIFCFFLILSQVPRHAMVRNQGPATWWKVVDRPNA